MPSRADAKALVHPLAGLFTLNPLPLLSLEGFHVAWLRAGKLPLAAGVRSRWADVLLDLRARVEAEHKGHLRWDPYLQMNELERPEGARIISRNGSRWMPMLTAGVWPDRESPEPLNAQDFYNMVPGVPMREPYFHLMRVSAPSEAARLEAARAVAGTGALLLALVDEADAESDRNEVTERLRGDMTHDEMRSYPAYFPLFDIQSVTKTAPEVLDDLLKGVLLYLREDVSEHAALLISRVPLEMLFGENAAMLS